MRRWWPGPVGGGMTPQRIAIPSRMGWSFGNVRVWQESGRLRFGVSADSTLREVELIFELTLALAMQAVSGTDAAKPRRISEELYYIDPYQRGAYSCDRQVAKQQGRIFRRRFKKRIEALKQKEASVLGSDSGFDVVPLKQCTPSDVVRSTRCRRLQS